RISQYSRKVVSDAVAPYFSALQFAFMFLLLSYIRF
ncbi:MAG: hypothetical protein ACI9VT_004058, partial [Psychroserpens sp.]